MNILIVKLSSLGDIVHTLPSLIALRKRFPHAHITWVAGESASDILMNNPHLDELLITRGRRWRSRPFSQNNLSDLSGFVKRLRSRRYDITIDFQGLLKSALVVALAKGKRKIGYGGAREFAHIFYSEKVDLETMELHAVDRYLNLIKHLGCNTDNPEFCIPVTDDDNNEVEQILASNGILIKGKKIVGVNPTGRWISKRWPQGKYLELARRIAAVENVVVVFIGGADEKDIVDAACPTEYKNVINLAGRTSLGRLSAILKRMDVLITNDTGPMHIAAALGTRVIAIFGPTNPVRTGPYGTDNTVIQAGMDCVPCYRKECAAMICMDAIDVDTVFRAVINDVVL